MTTLSAEQVENLGMSRAAFMQLVEQFNADSLNSSSLTFLSSEDNLEFFTWLASEAEEDDQALAKALWSAIDYGVDTEMSLGELADSSLYQAQFSIDPKAVSAILTDKFIGLSQTQRFVEPVTVVEDPQEEGKFILLGGHHRLFVMAYCMYHSGNTSWDVIFNQKVPVIVRRIITKELDERSEKERVASAHQLVTRMWLASNGSRKPQAVEKESFKYSSSGVSLYDKDSILDSDLLEPKKKFIMYCLALATEQGFLPDRHGHVQRQFMLDPQNPDPGLRTATFTRQTLESILTSFWSSLMKIKEVVPGSDEDGKKPKQYSVWELDMQKIPEEYAEGLFEVLPETGRNILDDAFIAAHKKLQASDKDLKGNRARNAVVYGQVLADTFQSEFQTPKHKPVPKGAGKKKSNRTKLIGRRFE